MLSTSSSSLVVHNQQNDAISLLTLLEPLKNVTETMLTKSGNGHGKPIHHYYAQMHTHTEQGLNIKLAEGLR